MNPYRMGRVMLGLASLGSLLTACGSEEQSTGLFDITVRATVVINEVCANEEGVCVLSAACATCGKEVCDESDVEEHARQDWIELHNLTPREVDLSGYYLSDSSKNPLKTKLPQGTRMAPHGYLLFFANAVGDGGRNLSFRLSNAAVSESVVLSSPTGEWLDQLWVPSGDERGSWARIPDGTGPQPDNSWFFPTPGWKNSDQCAVASQ